jgi:four helix bundle protein
MEQDKNNFFFRFEDLRIYHKALDYVCWVNEATRDFTACDELVRHYKNASQSIAVNIAEGSGRNKTQFIYYLKMAKSAIRECIVLSTIAHRQGQYDDAKLEESRQFLIEMTKMVGALISSLQRNLKGNEHADDEDSELLEDFNRYNP